MAALQQYTGQEKKKEGFNCEFVGPPSATETECPICHLTFQEPHKVMCCGKRFCWSCIKRVKDDDKPCPTCRAQEYNMFLDESFMQTLFRCNHQEDGCDWTGKLGQVDSHLNEDPVTGKELEGCQFVEIGCPYKCRDQFQRQQMPQHQTECTKRPFSCYHCHNYESNYDDVIHNHWPVCGSFLITCPNECGVELPRQKMNIEHECPLEIIKCDFHDVGCTVKLPRGNMPEHLETNRVQHLEYKVAAQADIIETLESRMRNQVQNHHCEIIILQKKLQANKLTPDPTIIILTNYAICKQTDHQWYSPPVSTCRGYKISLKVYANGYSGAGYGTHVSVYVYFMKGDFDNYLEWPFQGRLSISLLDQDKGEDHKTKTIEYTNETREFYNGKVTDGERARDGKGLHQFISHDELSSKYMRNDTLYFKVTE